MSDNPDIDHPNYNHSFTNYPSYQENQQPQSTSPLSVRKYRESKSFDFSSIQAQLPPNTGPPGTVPITNGSNSTNNKNLSHVPCKFFRQGICQAGNSCPFSHNLDGALGADKLPCKYFQKGNCKFGLKCALAHFLPDGTRVNSKNFLYANNNGNGNNTKSTIRRSSFNNYNLTSGSLNTSTPPEYENSFISASKSPSTSLPNNNVATFLNVGTVNVSQQQPPPPQSSQPQQQQQQQPISLSSIPQDSLARSSSLNRHDYQFPSSFQQQQNLTNNSNSYHHHQRSYSMQQSLFGSNSYSGAFSNGNANSTGLNGTSASGSPPSQLFSATGTAQTTPPGYASSTATTTPNSRFSFSSRLPSQQQIHQQQQPNLPPHSKSFSTYFQDGATGSAIADDDEFTMQRNGVMFEEDFIPSSLSDVILTPQELRRRVSRSQSGTLNVRPNFNGFFETKHDDDVFIMDNE
ncbi:LEE1 Zinc finger protein LEE1 [Candida maltosa Xu316]|uniref:Zinc finger protein, putative n=1 Tax=Candida maltosa (strain Xu316) TaxID=1245528 RepID=M3HFL1_CANMX|nr:Zinc finger protein, putative [Candida maltosa Xu316]